MSFLIIVFTIVSHVFSCSSFLIPSKGIMAKSYDWSIADGYVMTNSKSTKKTSMVLRSGDAGLAWTSKYSSITFNQYGRDFPNGGMNEKGLAVEILWLNSAGYPPADNRPTLNELQWIQYQLDNHANVREVVNNLNRVRISKVYADVHYFVCDSTLACATIEFVQGNAEIHTGSTMPYPTITNSTYAASKSFIASYQGFGGNLAIPQSYRSLDRYVRATDLARRVRSSDPVEKGFDILNSLESVGYTKWQILYDLRNKKVYFKTRFSNREMATFSFNDLPYSCSGNAFYLDLLSNQRGESLVWTVLTRTQNESLVRSSFTQLYGERVPQELLAAVVNHPYTYTCQ
jgi:penicillin V acylase-like amidase (Ntn superfamily)